jgi:hypothetical protein
MNMQSSILLLSGIGLMVFACFCNRWAKMATRPIDREELRVCRDLFMLMGIVAILAASMVALINLLLPASV